MTVPLLVKVPLLLNGPCTVPELLKVPPFVAVPCSVPLLMKVPPPLLVTLPFQVRPVSLVIVPVLPRTAPVQVPLALVIVPLLELTCEFIVPLLVTVPILAMRPPNVPLFCRVPLLVVMPVTDIVPVPWTVTAPPLFSVLLMVSPVPELTCMPAPALTDQARPLEPDTDQVAEPVTCMAPKPVYWPPIWFVLNVPLLEPPSRNVSLPSPETRPVIDEPLRISRTLLPPVKVMALAWPPVPEPPAMLPALMMVRSEP